MDYKKTKAANSTISRNIDQLAEETGNIYESVMILAKRSNQIASELKEELNQKLSEFASYTDNLEEVFENREQIEISKFYERLPKSTLIATQEFIEKGIYHRNPMKDSRKVRF
ncbi:MAG TPA: DNA-directed RNA polymerase subunit omega [Prolixibacteraceae bacterium]|nr:DNA-directed RNA polymerase subunit omega [Bacteroidales bacterium]HNZ71115.1 DNA-directed RNA polymerase subunit omega [Prolixibacteraceae bacterium]HQN93652.1 DNA-directed RNA polymerase subunit omega [Prolixibacteraceae bacterium]HUM89412.1 DNA-directed RNA polymerase subunit omega [Prolixibacteraceae bacterium]